MAEKNSSALSELEASGGGESTGESIGGKGSTTAGRVGSSASSDGEDVGIFTERVLKIASSQKIFLISNSNKNLAPGDFISLIKDDQLVARALVAKADDEVSGIKIVRVYSMKNWSSVRVRDELSIIRGDDSAYLAAKRRAREEAMNKEKKTTEVESADEEKKDSADFLSEKDLLGEGVDEDGGEEGGKRAIKTDNIIAFGYGLFNALDSSGADKRYPQFNGEWEYQIFDNAWVEGMYGRSDLKGFPSDDIKSTLNNYTVRGKYTVAAPFNSFVQPYVGYQILKVSSPDAGAQNDARSLDTKQLEKEKKLVGELNKKTFVFGVTVLKRLVPGWFARFDLGIDILNLAFAFEF
ncbi:MAG: hypothetical protein HQK53_09510 [Oligoflexia bacterium]|nr:hypothetical protein [Oligoflexia bacterium]